MTKRQRTSDGAAVRIARRILVAWNAAREADLKDQFDRVANLSVHGLNSLELERIELLRGIVQTLREAGAHEHRHRAAIRLLEHLAEGCGAKIEAGLTDSRLS